MLNPPYKDVVRTIFALLLLAHGVAHFVGFGHAWRILSPDPLPYRTTLVGSHLNVGDAGMRVIGVLWLGTGLGFVVASGAALLESGWWMGAAGVLAALSSMLCALERPDADTGLVLNAGIIAALLLAAWLSAQAAS